MQISGISTSTSIPLEKTKSTQVSKPAQDQAVMNFSADSFSTLVKEAGQMPEVRSDVVDAFKARIQSGEYPSQDVIAGLANVIGGAIVQQADS
jgi:anti-sigma28 factor (negative regulator of flagellin synthesis)